MTTTTSAPALPRTRPRAARPWGLYVALLLTAWFAVSALWPGLLAPDDPLELHLDSALAAPGPHHLLGTDEAGRDLYSRIVHGTAPALAIGFGASLVSLALALVLGGLAALAARPVASVVDRVVEVLLSFPSLLLALLLVALLGQSALTEAVAVGVGTAPGYARMIRGQILATKSSPYVEAAVTLGHSRTRILRQHVLPNAVRPLVAVFALSVGQSVVWASSLSFLGLGVAPPSSEWGALLDAGRLYLTHAWWLTIVPGLVIVVLALTATTLGKHLQASLERNDR